MRFENKFNLTPQQSLFLAKKKWDENVYCGMKMENRAVVNQRLCVCHPLIAIATAAFRIHIFVEGCQLFVAVLHKTCNFIFKAW